MVSRTRVQVSGLDLDFAFFTYLHQFYRTQRGEVRRHYKELSKRFLDFNNPENATAFLRAPQYEALEMYVFLKEFLDNARVHEIFEGWYYKTGRFAGRKDVGLAGEQMGIFGQFDEGQYTAVFNRMRLSNALYSNYIFALTMGTGKTILMATCIFYEFILSNKFPKDPRFCHNALVFAPDRTVLQALKEIQTFDMRLVVPPEYVNFLSMNMQFHFLEEAGTSLSTIDRSRFNIIISNTQKIILKRQRKEQGAAGHLFGSGKLLYQAGSVYEEFSDLYGDLDAPQDEGDLILNQRFSKLSRLEQLGVYVDEAHHAFGSQLAKDMGVEKSPTSLRITINKLAESLQRAGSRVVACYNFTGTPYVKNQVLPEVVYAYGLKEAINNEYLKEVKLHSYTNTRTREFVNAAVKHFWEAVGEDRSRTEGMVPKLAFFASTIEELQNELRPAVEAALIKYGIPLSRILVNVGDNKITSNDDIREFNRLDTCDSEKQFVLLVNKGREGWNCRSLFGVALFRKPKSRIFVLQATMRCLRAISEVQQTGHVYLSAENTQILEEELQQNFRVDIESLRRSNENKQIYEIRPVPPPVKITLKRIRKLHQLREKALKKGTALGIESLNTEKYRLIHTERDGVSFTGSARQEDLTSEKERRIFSRMMLVAEIARYLNLPCLRVEEILDNTVERTDAVLEIVNRYNEVLYDWVIPRIFNWVYDLVPYEHHEEIEVELVKVPPEGVYRKLADPKHVIRRDDELARKKVDKSFHLDTYCFDSRPEQRLFWDLLGERRIEKVYFTGMLTHGQTDFFIQYIDPESHTVRSYYPDFMCQREDGSWMIVEVKRDDQIETPVVQAKKESASQIAAASEMIYRIIKGTDAAAGHYSQLFQ
ncbi:MAG TPA: TnsA endonuclease N-terminal domain-containing protein [Pyrinomonadaceae bacterium]